MPSSYVTLGRDSTGKIPTDVTHEVGFWMTDWYLELWLHLLALQVKPSSDDHLATKIRNQWLLASMHAWGGCVPHGMEEATSTPGGELIVRSAVATLREKLAASDEALPASTLNLLGVEGRWREDFYRSLLVEIGNAFQDLLDGRVSTTVSYRGNWPGSGQWLRSYG